MTRIFLFCNFTQLSEPTVRMKQLFFAVLFSFLAQGLSAQIDKEFWFVGPEAAANHGDRPVYIRISTMDDPAQINLRMPANLNFAPVNQTIAANSSFSIRLDNIGGNTTWLDSIENRPADQVLNKGILLTSDNLVTAYYEIAHPNNPGIWPMKGKNALGLEFYISGQNSYANQTNDGSEAFDIVASEDNTTVTITPTIDIVGHPANIPFQVHLNKGQTYSARTLITTASASLMGSHVVADKPIAITISDDSIITGGWDIIGDQTIPVNLLGTEYIVIKGFADNTPPNNNDERVYILATHDNTDIFLDGGSTPVGTIGTGQTFNYGIPGSSNTACIKSSKPVYVYHLSGHPGESGASLLPQDSCTGSRKIGFTRSSTYSFAFLILTRSGYQDSFYLNGNKNIITGSMFSPVPGTSGAWVYYRQNDIPLSWVPVGANLIENTKGKFHLGIINNVSASSEYGYFSDFSTLYLGADESMCPSDSMKLDAGPYKTSYEWRHYESGNWVTVGTQRYYTAHDTGFFACMTSGDFCTLSDTLHISYYPMGIVNLGPDRTICQGTTMTFDAGPYVTYFWSNGATTRYMTTGDAGIYWVRVTNNNDCIAIDSVSLFVDSLPNANKPITGPANVCQGQNGVVFAIDPLIFSTSYQWTLPPGASGNSTTNSITLNFSTNAASGNLMVHGVNACGTGKDTTFAITVDPLPYAAGSIAGPGTVCQGQAGVAFTAPDIKHAASYIWSLPPGATLSGGAGTKSITVDFALNASPGIISVYGQNACGNGASSSIPLQVNLFPLPAGPVTGSATVCQGQSGVVYSIPLVTGADTYAWTIPPGAAIISGNGTPTVVVDFLIGATSGNITVYGHSNLCGDGIPAVFYVLVNPLPALAGPISGADNACQGQTGAVYSVNPITEATSYTWSLPPGAVITAGAGTNSITVSFSNSAASGNISVKGYNTLCGDGISSFRMITVEPLPGAAGNISGTSPVCQTVQGVPYSVPAIQNSSSYIWNYSGTGTLLTNNGNSTTMDFSETASSGNLTVRGHNGCGDGPVSPAFSLTVNLVSQVTLNICNSIMTHNARPFVLKGGIPLGGTYSGTAVSGGIFTPSLVPASKDSVHIKYTYINMYGCIRSAIQILTVHPTTSFTCGGMLVDVRDGKQYPTVEIGGKCWMAANLDHGIRIDGTRTQDDNCIAEKYCYRDLSANCVLYGGLYQWDEVMQYNSAALEQGLCPPAWHIPSETEWNQLFNHYVTSGYAGNPLKYSGYSGFNALLAGFLSANKSWDLEGFATMIWSSEAIGNTKSWAHGLNETDPSVSYYPASRSEGFSVRCIRD
jgi:uncharacterized protein (TIGR02145 family)